MKEHQNPHAQPFDQEHDHNCYIEGIFRADLLSAEEVTIDYESANVRECEKDGDCGVGASFSPKSVSDFTVVPCSPFLADSSLRFHEEPDNQKCHYYHLAQETVANYIVHNARMFSKGVSIMTCFVRIHNDSDDPSNESYRDGSKKYGTCRAQPILAFLRNFRVYSWILDAHGQFKSDVVLNEADTELCNLLYIIDVLVDRSRWPVTDNEDESEKYGDERVEVEWEDWKIPVLLLLH